MESAARARFQNSEAIYQRRVFSGQSFHVFSVGLYPPFYPPMEIFERDLSASETMRFARFALALSTSDQIGKIERTR